MFATLLAVFATRPAVVRFGREHRASRSPTMAAAPSGGGGEGAEAPVPFNGLSCGAFKMQAYKGNVQRQRIAQFLEAQGEGGGVTEGAGSEASGARGEAPSSTSDNAPTLAALARRARGLREAWGLPSAGDTPWVSELDFTFDSTFLKGEGDTAVSRSWANWLVPGRLMLGQYPHCQPAQPGPSADAARVHLDAVAAAGVDGFACLQAELPPQDDDARWPAAGVHLPDAADRLRWPAPFLRYAADAAAAAKSASGGKTPRFYHYGIEDLSVPVEEGALLCAIDDLLRHYCTGGTALYLHCWGGRGRAGLVGACLLSLLCPHLSVEVLLVAVQRAYDSRTGAAAMLAALRRSPQTEPQRDFVRSFVAKVQAVA